MEVNLESTTESSSEINIRQVALRTMLAQAEEMKLFPAAAERVRSIADDPDSDLAALEQAVATDPTLSAQMLKVANSPFFGLSREVANLRQGILVIGFQATRDMALALAMLSLSGQDNPTYRTLWKHCLRTAAAAREIAEQIGMAPQEAFVAGLLHDMGRFIFLALHHDYEAVISRSLADQHRVFEEQRFGFTHSELGAACLEHWNLPKRLCLSVRFHDTPHAIPEELTLADRDLRRLTALIYVADQLAYLGEPTLDTLINEPFNQAMATLGVDASVLQDVLAGLPCMDDELSFS